MKYRYNSSKKRGDIVVVQEFEQECKKCNTMLKPRFEIEATEKAMQKVIQRIKKAFYGRQTAGYLRKNIPWSIGIFSVKSSAKIMPGQNTTD